MLGNAGIPERFKDFTFETFRERCGVEHLEQKDWPLRCCEAFATAGSLALEGEIKPGVVLFGSFGTGKTGLASATLHARASGGQAVTWLDHIEFCKKVQDTYGEDSDLSSNKLITAAAQSEFLLFDDLGDIEQRFMMKTASGPVLRMKPITDDKRGITYDVLTRRHRELKPTIITTNLGIDEFIEHFGERIFDRVWEMCHWIEVGGANFRRSK